MSLQVTHGLHSVHLIHQETNKLITEEKTAIFSKDLKNKVMKIINYEKKKLIPFWNDDNKSYQKQKVSYTYKKEISTNINNENEFRIYQKVKDLSLHTKI